LLFSVTFGWSVFFWGEENSGNRLLVFFNALEAPGFNFQQVLRVSFRLLYSFMQLTPQNLNFLRMLWILYVLYCTTLYAYLRSLATVCLRTVDILFR